MELRLHLGKMGVPSSLEVVRTQGFPGREDTGPVLFPGSRHDLPKPLCHRFHMWDSQRDASKWVALSGFDLGLQCRGKKIWYVFPPTFNYETF